MSEAVGEAVVGAIVVVGEKVGTLLRGATGGKDSHVHPQSLNPILKSVAYDSVPSWSSTAATASK